MLEWLETVNSKLSRWGAYISSTLFVLLVILIMTEIIGRSFFDYSTMLADEYSGYFYLAAVFFGLAFTFNEEGHIRINIITARLSDEKRRYVDIFAGILNTFVLVFVLYYCWLFMVDSKEMEMLSENVSETPLYLTQIPMPIGITLFIIAACVFTYKRICDDS
ncbi:TRAP transporter small permease subunit [Sulfurospirillum arcachonense]|uniref:TRAP transporter small permease subunit n=1 Tax=Sulfurospirillum arcachonense TaxID=57666 RepID=UPI000469ABC7|nr:TRAP transporter small permease [Sulfurospirillum arcachonense]